MTDPDTTLSRAHNVAPPPNPSADLVRTQLLASVLLEALRLLVEDCEDYSAWQRPCYALDKAKEAIALAEGKDQ